MFSFQNILHLGFMVTYQKYKGNFLVWVNSKKYEALIAVRHKGPYFYNKKSFGARFLKIFAKKVFSQRIFFEKDKK